METGFNHRLNHIWSRVSISLQMREARLPPGQLISNEEADHR